MLLSEIKKILEKLLECAEKNKKQLEYQLDDLLLFRAGKEKDQEKGFYIFARDILFTSLMLKDSNILKDILKFCIQNQGKKIDALTAEEPGKIFHEWPGVQIGDYRTDYNASDTTALFLIGMELYWKLTKDTKFINQNKDSIQAGIGYILKHIKKDLFWEDPKFCSAKNFALNATYWKDSGIPQREKNSPVYPVVYTLLQAQVVKGLRAAAKLLEILKIDNSEKLKLRAKKCAKKIFTELWHEKSNYLVIAMDSKGKIPAASSDSLHMLYYLEPEDVPKEKLRLILKAAERLKTQFGFRSYAAMQKEYAPDSYQFGSIWPFEQYFIAEGLLKYKRFDLINIAFRTAFALEHLGVFPESIYYYAKNKVRPVGYPMQLWTSIYPEAMLTLLKKIEKIPIINRINFYKQTTRFTCAAASLMIILNYFNPNYKLNKKKEFRVWQRSVDLPTRGSDIFGLAIIAKPKGLSIKAVIEEPKYSFPGYKFKGYKLNEVEMAAYSSYLYYKRAMRLGVHIEERNFDLSEVKKLLEGGRVILLRLNMSQFRTGRLGKISTHYFPIFEYKDNKFLVADPAKRLMYIDESIIKEAFKGVKTISKKDNRMIIFS